MTNQPERRDMNDKSTQAGQQNQGTSKVGKVDTGQQQQSHTGQGQQGSGSGQGSQQHQHESNK